MATEIGLLDRYSGEICRAGASYINALKDRQTAVATRREILAQELYRVRKAEWSQNALDPLDDTQDMQGYSQTVIYTQRSGVKERSRKAAAATRVQVTLDLRMEVAAQLAEVAALRPQAAP